ncbi:MAG TPA: ATP-dependent helicase [Candidatus Limnocylindrales bacterium]|jgi:superfamily I DNA/RNA helicase|nr:ATP-dependent helicase [Candidatus Limnocylindrales bacterium]
MAVRVPHPAVAERLSRLTPDQRAAATAPPGPVLCVAPAGSGKTTTLVARIAWLVDGGADPATIAAITFNKGAADELATRLDAALEPLSIGRGQVRVRTFHALGREIRRDAGLPVEPMIDRESIVQELMPGIPPAERARLDTAFSRLKLDLVVDTDAVAKDPDAGPVARAFVAYQRELADRGALDFDDLVRGAHDALRAEAALLSRWRQRCQHLLVDEVQDVDRCQLQLALLLASPADRIFLVGDDDQSIYGWRLADVRRVLAIGSTLAGLRRVDLEVNHRCPAPVVERAVRLIEHNEERFGKRIRPRADAHGSLVLAPDASDEPTRTERLLRSWPDDDGTQAVLARTNRELRPAVIAALGLGMPFRAPSVELLVDRPALDALLARVERETPAALPLLVRLGRLRGSVDDATWSEREIAAAMLAWAAPFPDLGRFVAAIAEVRALLAELRRDDARLSLATAHSTKGAEFDHVAVVGLEEGRFPSGRAVAEADDLGRALEEERRLAYVAWTRARRTLTLSYDPAVPSPFLLEAFEPAELVG